MAVKRKPRQQSQQRSLSLFLRILCPLCGACHFETTEKYDADKMPHPGMIKMLAKYKEYGWPEPPQDDSAGYGCLECLDCGNALAPNGKLKVGK